MKLAFRQTVRRTALALTMAVVGLSVGALAAPAAHASLFGPPTITTSISDINNSIQVLNVAGTHFAPGGQVTVQVYDSSYHLVSSRTVTASSVTCGPLVCFGGGAFSTGFEYFATLPHPHGTVHVIAGDLTTGRWSNWSNATFPSYW
ncbi:MAG: hypothetical protein JOZ41_08490 [Chloroflexi bacterium]|nr:hypothetical protein [Chloroflexota bacterium]